MQYNDVALLQLQDPFQLSATVTPVCIARAKPDAHIICVATGWGWPGKPNLEY